MSYYTKHTFNSKPTQMHIQKFLESSEEGSQQICKRKNVDISTGYADML